VNALDQQLIALLKVNARLPVVKLAQALGCARSTVQLRLRALESSGAITGYTIGVARPAQSAGIRAVVLIATASNAEPNVIKALARRHEITKLYTVSGRYDLCALVHTESTDEFDAVINRIRGVQGVQETFSTMLLSTKIDRPE
jgi:DNA-binding Lrp family transcriptional regulator